MLKLIAKVLAVPVVTDWLIRRSARTPYVHLEGYMDRFWVFNPYEAVSEIRKFGWIPFSIRVHHILREDDDRHLHDHPWNARTFILRGWYEEVREDGRLIRRDAGDTARIAFGEFHAIREVSPGGVWTLFVTTRYRGTWGFKVNGYKVPWREYFKGRQG